MITLIIKSYLTILLSIGIGSALLFGMGLYWIFRKNTDVSLTTENDDMTAIAGDDVLATQLDLARAYIETDNRDSAKKILLAVMAEGSQPQQHEAQQLLNHL